ncbi:DUF3784 domain-containing protein [Dyadobacter sp. CY345]|uniref:DUF3784 domain-containing protein n=1 Tax=Dyadobacter sp. CY345 TaxID=2909335 RepID=UPI001F1E0F56|nr:DUF3784 domain-containing protein [Dyadobacter sp. CY345]MCF2446046.1 DUF3784 domain-containing protein [Dyadobacter sp. CY345]
MLIPALILSVVFSSMAFIVTKSNAKFILSGYNTMSEAQRAFVDIDAYLKFYKQFHLFLGLSVLAGMLLLEMVDKNLAGVFLGMYPLLAYLYFIVKSQKYFSEVKNQKVGNVIVVAVLIFAVGGVGYLFFNGLKNSEIQLNADNLEITGMYGEKIDRDKILGTKLVSELPEIKIRSNGFSAGDFRKGDFRTKDGKTVKLIVNNTEKPFLMLNTGEGEIYFSSTIQSSEDLMGRIEKWKKP